MNPITSAKLVPANKVWDKTTAPAERFKALRTIAEEIKTEALTAFQRPDRVDKNALALVSEDLRHFREFLENSTPSFPVPQRFADALAEADEANRIAGEQSFGRKPVVSGEWAKQRTAIYYYNPEEPRPRNALLASYHRKAGNPDWSLAESREGAAQKTLSRSIGNFKNARKAIHAGARWPGLRKPLAQLVEHDFRRGIGRIAILANAANSVKREGILAMHESPGEVENAMYMNILSS